MPYSILKLDIIMSRWDEKDPLIGTWHDPEQKVNMGERGWCFYFFHRMLQKHASFQNDSCDRLICEFMSALAVMTRKLCWAHRERGIRESSHLQTRWRNFLSSPWATARRADLVSTLETTRKADSWGGRTATRFHQRHCFWPFRPAPYSYESLCTLPICLLLDNFKS